MRANQRLSWLIMAIPLLVAGLAFAACSGGSKRATPPTPTATASESATPPAAATAEATTKPEVTGDPTLDAIIRGVVSGDRAVLAPLLRPTNVTCSGAYSIAPECGDSPEGMPLPSIWTFQCQARWVPVAAIQAAQAPLPAGRYRLYAVTNGGPPAGRDPSLEVEHWLLFEGIDANLPGGFAVASGDNHILAFGYSCGETDAFLRQYVEQASSLRFGPLRTASDAPPSATRRKLVQVENVPIPGGSSVIFASCGYAHGHGGCWLVERAVRDQHGELRREQLFDASKYEGTGANITGIEADEKGVIFMSVCLGDQCAYEGQKQVRTRLLVSRDGGVTWNQEGPQLEGEWWASAAASGSALLVNFEGMEPTWKQMPANVAVAPPAGADSCCQAWGIDGAFVWSAKDTNALLAADGTRLAAFVAPPGHTSGRVSSAMIVGSNLAVTWTLSDASETYLGLFEASGAQVEQPLRVPSGFDLRAQSDDRMLMATVDYTRPGTCTAQGLTMGADPALVDLHTGTYAYIGEPFYDPNCSHGTQRVIVRSFATARVNTPGDCLNVRQHASASAPIVTCLHDGVLLQLIPPPTDTFADESWQFVWLPDSRTGWVAKEYLVR